METITFYTDDNEQINFYVLEETQLSGIKYLLVCETEDGDSDAYILKMVSEEGEDALYEIVEDDVEFSAVAKLFEELVGEEADFEF